MKNFISKFWWLISGIAGIIVIKILELIYPSPIALLMTSLSLPIIFLSSYLKSETFMVISLNIYIPAIQFLLGVIFGAIVRSFIIGRKEKQIIQNVAFDKKKSIFTILFLPTILLVIQVILLCLMSYFLALDEVSGGWEFIGAIAIFPSIIVVGIINVLVSVARFIRSKTTVVRIILMIYIALSAYLIFPPNQVWLADFLKPLFIPIALLIRK